VTNAWPYPGEGQIVRARRVAAAYRQALWDIDAEACAEVDSLMLSFGQNWVAPRVVQYEPERWLSARDAAELAAVEMAQLRQWRSRGLLTGQRIGGSWFYQAKEVMALSTEVRRRNRSTEEE